MCGLVRSIQGRTHSLAFVFDSIFLSQLKNKLRCKSAAMSSTASSHKKKKTSNIAGLAAMLNLDPQSAVKKSRALRKGRRASIDVSAAPPPAAPAPPAPRASPAAPRSVFDADGDDEWGSDSSASSDDGDEAAPVPSSTIAAAAVAALKQRQATAAAATPETTAAAPPSLPATGLPPPPSPLPPAPAVVAAVEKLMPAAALGIPVEGRVEARYRGRAHWFRGKVVDRAASGGGYLYSIAYDDGEVETGVSSDFVRIDPLAAVAPPTPSSRDERYVSITHSPGHPQPAAPALKPAPPVACVNAETGRLVVGAVVESNFADSGVWHSATITAVNVNESQWNRNLRRDGAATASDATTYDIRYADGYASRRVAPTLLRSAPTSVGPRFDALAATKLRRAAALADAKGGGEVASDGGGGAEKIVALTLGDDGAAHPMRRALRSDLIAITLRSKVKVNFAHCGQLYAGEVVWIHTDGSLDVRYEDGYTEKRVERSLVQLDEAAAVAVTPTAVARPPPPKMEAEGKATVSGEEASPAAHTPPTSPPSRARLATIDAVSPMPTSLLDAVAAKALVTKSSASAVKVIEEKEASWALERLRLQHALEAKEAAWQLERTALVHRASLTATDSGAVEEKLNAAGKDMRALTEWAKDEITGLQQRLRDLDLNAVADRARSVAAAAAAAAARCSDEAAAAIGVEQARQAEATLAAEIEAAAEAQRASNAAAASAAEAAALHRACAAGCRVAALATLASALTAQTAQTKASSAAAQAHHEAVNGKASKSYTQLTADAAAKLVEVTALHTAALDEKRLLVAAELAVRNELTEVRRGHLEAAVAFESEKTDLEARSETLEEELEAQRAEATAASATAASALADVNDDLRAVQEQLAAEQALRERTELDLAGARDELVELRASLEQSDEEHAAAVVAAEAAMVAAEERYAATASELCDAQSALSAVQADLERSRAEAVQVASDADALRAELEEAQSAHAQLQTRLETKEAQLMSEMERAGVAEAEVVRLGSELSAARDAADAAAKMTTEHASEAERLRGAHAEREEDVQRLTAAVALHATQSGDAGEALASAQADLVAVRAELEETATRLADISAAAAHSGMLRRKEVATLRDELKSAQSAAAAAAALRSEEEVQALRSQLGSARVDADAAAALRSEVQALRAQLASARVDATALLRAEAESISATAAAAATPAEFDAAWVQSATKKALSNFIEQTRGRPPMCTCPRCASVSFILRTAACVLTSAPLCLYSSFPPPTHTTRTFSQEQVEESKACGAARLGDGDPYRCL